ncbi:MAG: hypothetical protein IJF87_11685 [Erysipelotrichaceae bacterium]|nr:hypothetical protein [Erysipelotrichaceae bacterium]
MKKLSVLTLILFMFLSLASCKKEQEIAEPVDGGWTKVEDGTITPELQEMFDKAMEGMLGVDYVPVELLETQVVAGMNYKFRCEATVVYPGAEPKEAIVTIYKDTEGNLTVTEIQTDEPDPVPAGNAYTEDMFDMTFDFFDTISFDTEGKDSLAIAEIYGLWQGVLARKFDDGSVDRELCFINIYDKDGKMMMDVTPKVRQEDDHVSETDHYIGTFERSEGNNPTFVNGGMIIKFDMALTDGEHQYILGGMDIPEINESSTLQMYR